MLKYQDILAICLNYWQYILKILHILRNKFIVNYSYNFCIKLDYRSRIRLKFYYFKINKSELNQRFFTRLNAFIRSNHRFGSFWKCEFNRLYRIPNYSMLKIKETLGIY